MFDFMNSLLVGSFLDVFMFSIAGSERLTESTATAYIYVVRTGANYQVLSLLSVPVMMKYSMPEMH